MESLAGLRPEDEEGLVLARRVFPDGRTRAYAWGRSAAREDLAAAGERLIAMSGQFEQRRLARPRTSSTSSTRSSATSSSGFAGSCARPGASWLPRVAGTTRSARARRARKPGSRSCARSSQTPRVSPSRRRGGRSGPSASGYGI